MKVLQQILDFYINTSIHVAVAVFSLVQITKLTLNISSNIEIDFFIFFATIFGYNFLKYFEVFWNQIFTIKNKYSIVLVNLIAIFGMIFYFFKLEKPIQVSFFKIGFIVLLYPFLRKYGLFKMLIVAFCITYVTAYIPQINSYHNYIYLFQRFLIVFCLLIPLEICDLEIDSQTIRTLPKIIGIQNLKILGYLLLVCCCLLNFYLLQSNFETDIVIAIVIAIAIFFSNENRNSYYTSFWVESIPIFWYFLYLFTK